MISVSRDRFETRSREQIGAVKNAKVSGISELSSQTLARVRTKK